jgi:hypothetical protein
VVGPPSPESVAEFFGGGLEGLTVHAQDVGRGLSPDRAPADPTEGGTGEGLGAHRCSSGETVVGGWCGAKAPAPPPHLPSEFGEVR